jgi:hypothetical protein
MQYQQTITKQEGVVHQLDHSLSGHKAALP